MQIQKRNFPMYVLLNCLTLGIYGFIVSMQINKEIEALCKGDGEEPKTSYAGAWGIRLLLPLVSTLGLAVAGAIVGFLLTLILGIVPALGASANFGFLDFDLGFYSFNVGTATYGSILVLGLGGGAAIGGSIGSIFGVLLGTHYYNFWWYKQANRLKFNANRYGMKVKEKGTDIYLFRTALQPLLTPVTALLYVGTWLVPGIIIALISLSKLPVLILIFGIFFALPFFLFRYELTGGANFSMFFIMKNLNRFADASRGGAKPFDPMAYEYYPSINNFYINSLPNMVDGTNALAPQNVIQDEPWMPEPDATDYISTGSITGLNGTCSGYSFNLTTGEEIVIGKDAKVSSVVIDPAYKEISRKHVGIIYDIIQDAYRVTDYSSNGTWADGQKLAQGVETICRHGTTLRLANDKNTFRLG